MKVSKLFRKVAAVGAALAMTATAAACGGGSDDKSITIGYIEWDEAVATSHMWKHILEEQGYDVELKALQAGLIFQGLADGEIDFYLDAWLPQTHKDYMDKYGDQVEKLGNWYGGEATLNITVPEYVEDVNSMEDLAANADQLGNKIIGIEQGAGLMKATEENMIPDYGLEGKLDLKTSSTPAMLTELETAYEKEEPIVVTLWHPHWAYAEYDLKDLEDPKGSMGEGETIETLGSEDFVEDHKDVADMLKKFKMSDEELADLENFVFNKGDDEAAGAKAWLDENPDFAKTLK